MDTPQETFNNPIWFVAHTRPRCEKKLVQFCSQEKVDTTLPLYQTVHKYRGKTVTFTKPLFPGYVFLNMSPIKRQGIYQSNYVANLLEVFDQDVFNLQLQDILTALDSSLPITLVPEIGRGNRVVIKSGPLEGMEGWVENRHGPAMVMLRLDFIGQAAAVEIEAHQLQLV